MPRQTKGAGGRRSQSGPKIDHTIQSVITVLTERRGGVTPSLHPSGDVTAVLYLDDMPEGCNNFKTIFNGSDNFGPERRGVVVIQIQNNLLGLTVKEGKLREKISQINRLPEFHGPDGKPWMKFVIAGPPLHLGIMAVVRAETNHMGVEEFDVALTKILELMKNNWPIHGALS